MGLKIGFSDNTSDDFERPAIGFSRDRSGQSYSYGTVDGRDDLFLETPKRDGNPNKYRYKLVRTMRIGRVLVVQLNYPDCFNYNGDKICVFDDATRFLAIHHQERCIDPHFLEKTYSPVARFEPTPRGWDLAINFAKILNQDIRVDVENA